MAESKPITERVESKGGYGFLVTDGRITQTGDLKMVPPGICPKCQKPAPPWEPPVTDFRYMNRIKAIREIYHLDSDELAHAQYLKETGGYIASCDCNLTYFVPSSVAKVKDDVG